MNRRTFLQSAAIPMLAPVGTAWPAAGFPSTPPDRALFPCPADGSEAGVNPPGFAWWRAEGAASYRVVIRGDSGRTVYEADQLKDPVHLPVRTLPPGDYTWDVEAISGNGATIARRGVQRFTVPSGAPELPWEDPKTILARVPDGRPRYIFLKADLPRIRESLKTTRRRAWEDVRARAEQALKLPLPEPPRYHTFDTRVRQRMGYVHYFRDFRGYLDQGMSVLALAYLLSGQERYGLAAKKILLEVESWGVGGPMSVLSSFGDEPGLSMARHGHRAYDWLYPLFDESERARVRKMTIDRARQVLERLRKRDYLAFPAESHNGRLIAYLSEYAVVLTGEAPDAAEWLDYSLRALTTFYPHWAGADGGWAEGIGYALAYNTIYLPALESLRTATGFDLYNRPFFRNVRRFFLYCASPIGEIRPFGDGAERGGVGSQGATLLAHFGRRFGDPASVWWAGQTGEKAAGSEAMVSLITEDNVKPAPPSDLPSAAVFRGIGWAALHSALDKPKQDTFLLFKSSPYGSVSHSHADQNSFAILKGGHALAIPSGHYGPAYGMPHHAEWTRQTKANNSVLVNGEGQIVREATARGRITEFRHQRAITYLCGDAAPAYGGKLKRFLRHVLFLRPGVFIVLDELEAPEPAEFQWLLHTFDKMSVAPDASMVTSTRHGATLTARLMCDAGLAFGQTGQFDTPLNEGNPSEYHEDRPNHWHFTATTRQRQPRCAITAVMLVKDSSESIEVDWRDDPLRSGIEIKTPSGTGEAWAETAPAIRLFARWRPTTGAAEEMLIRPG